MGLARWLSKQVLAQRGSGAVVFLASTGRRQADKDYPLLLPLKSVLQIYVRKLRILPPRAGVWDPRRYPKEA